MKFTLVAFLGLLCFSGFAQSTTSPDLAPGYYVVIASYAAGQDSYAKSYSDKVNQDGKHTMFGFDPTRKFIHVYLDQYTDFAESIRQMEKARKEGFETAWVRIMKGLPAEAQPNSPEQKITAPAVVSKTPATTTPVTSTTPVVAPTQPTVAEPKPAVAETPVAATTNTTTTTATPTTATTPTEPPKPEMPVVTNNDPNYNPKLLKEGTVLLTLYNPTNNVEVDGGVEVVDGERSKLLKKEKGNDFVTLPDPKSKTGKLILIASSFGYRPVQHEINYKASDKDTLENFVDVVDNHYRIRFDMVRLRRGDITVLYNVYFYNDAAIMLPDSKYELNKLLAMLKDNIGYKIRLHGHTNGNGSGKIITMGKDKDFFALNSDNNTSVGSAKELSRNRAQVIKDWLVANGIDGSRVEVLGHGGNRMLHDKNSANAKRNVRVEVEMTAE